MNFVFEVEDVKKVYNEAIALDGVTLSIEKGDVFGIIGLSGAGKSTLIRCLAHLVCPTSGRVLFHGSDLRSMKKRELRSFRKKVGMIFQNFNLLSSRTVEENIAYPLEIAGVPKEEQRKIVDELLGLVGLKHKCGAYPSKLSGGEKQRVGIARALANHPEILLCDEATSALDPKTTKEILSLLKKVNRTLGLTIVLITHEMEVVKQICNKVAVIEKGKIVEEGLVVDVFADPKHPTTKQFLQSSSHEIPPEFFKKADKNAKLLRLKFKGEASSEPIISALSRKFDVNANILLGWIDRLQTMSIGTLVIALEGSEEKIPQALQFLKDHHIDYEELA